MRTLVFLVCAVSAAAFLQKPSEQGKLAAGKKAAEDVPTLTKKLEQIVGGLEGIYAQQEKSSNGPSNFAKILKPFLTEMHAVLKEVQTDKKLTEAQKLEKLHNAEASVSGLKKDMAKLTTDLKAEGEEEKESLLMGVLMSRKDKPEAQQLEVMKSDDFKNLEVVKYVLAHRDAKKSLVEQVAAHLDSKPHSKSSSRLSLQATTQQIATKLDGFLKNLENHLAHQEKLHKKVSNELAEQLKKDEAKMASLKGKDKNLKDKSVNEEKAKAARSVKLVKRMQKKENREYLKQHALMERDVSALKKAIAGVQKGDMRAVGQMQQVLKDSISAMKGRDDFLHFLQLSEYTDSRSGDCPYCKAQCLEKCHNDGHSFMECMGTCANAGN